MINKSFKNTIKVISVVLSLLMVWQNLVWANPDISRPETAATSDLKTTLQAHSMFTHPDPYSEYRRAFTGYLTSKIIQTELDPTQRNISAMYRRVYMDVLEVRRGFVDAGRDPEKDPIDFVKIKDNTSEGFFVVDMGDSLFRYYDPNIPGISAPGDIYEVEEEVAVGKYLVRQKLKKSDHGDGFIARGSSERLADIFLNDETEKTHLRTNISGRIDQVLRGISHRVQFSRVTTDELAKMAKVLDDIRSTELIEFDGIVLADTSSKRKLITSIKQDLKEEDHSDRIEKAIMRMDHDLFFYTVSQVINKTSPSLGGISVLSEIPEAEELFLALQELKSDDLEKVEKAIKSLNTKPIEADSWLLGVNTVSSSAGSKLSEKYPNTIALSNEILDLIEKDSALVEEYLFHEFICPVLGHERTREMQELMFPENYKDIEGDKQKGHKDGELALVIKKVLYDGTLFYNGDLPSESEIQDMIKDFEGYTFKGDGPQKATRIYSMYTKWHTLRMRQLLWHTSRISGENADAAKEEISKLKAQNELMFTRLNWVWDCSVPWDNLQAHLAGRGMNELGLSDKEKAKELAQAVKDAHRDFMDKSSFISNESMRDVMAEVDEILYGRKVEVIEDKSLDAPVEVKKPEPKEEIKPSEKEKSDVAEEKQAKEEKKSKDKKKTTEKKKKTPRQNKGLWRSIKDWYLMFSFRDFAVMMSIAVGVSFILYLVLPVNVWTKTIASVLPLTFFVIMLVRNFSWKHLFSAIAISFILSYFLPLPWLGLSMVITMLIGAKLKGYSVFAKRPKGMPVSSSKQEASEMQEEDAEEKGARSAESSEAKEGRSEDSDKKSQEGSSSEEIKGEKAKEMLDKLPDEWNPLKDVHIEFDVLKIIFQLINLMYPKKKDSEEAEGGSAAENNLKEKLDTRRVLDAIFRLDYDEELEYDPAVKDGLRPYVKAWFNKPERSYDSNFLQYDRVLKNWKSTSDQDLSNALNEVTQEVSQYVLQSNGPNSVGEMTAVQALVAEHYAIEEARLQAIRRMLGLLTLRERVKSGELIGNVEAKEYYTLGRFEFYFEFFERAERAFSNAVFKEDNNEDYYLTLGIVDHFTQHWDKAEKAYETTIKLREKPKELSEEAKKEMSRNFEAISKKKLQLARLLLKKVRSRITLNGDKADDEDGAANSYLANLYHNILWKLFVVGSTFFHEAGHFIYASLSGQKAKITFREMMGGRIRGVKANARKYGGILGNLTGTFFGLTGFMLWYIDLAGALALYGGAYLFVINYVSYFSEFLPGGDLYTYGEGRLFDVLEDFHSTDIYELEGKELVDFARVYAFRKHLENSRGLDIPKMEYKDLALLLKEHLKYEVDVVELAKFDISKKLAAASLVELFFNVQDAMDMIETEWRAFSALYEEVMGDLPDGWDSSLGEEGDVIRAICRGNETLEQYYTNSMISFYPLLKVKEDILQKKLTIALDFGIVSRRDVVEGILNSYPAEGRSINDKAMDWILLTDPIPGDEKIVSGQDLRYFYQGNPYDLLVEVFRELQMTEEDVFYDIGSGYGRVVFLGSILTDAKESVGIELDSKRVDKSYYSAHDMGLDNVLFADGDASEFDISEGNVFFVDLSVLDGRRDDTLKVLGRQFRDIAQEKKITIVAQGATRKYFDDECEAGWYSKGKTFSAKGHNITIYTSLSEEEAVGQETSSEEAVLSASSKPLWWIAIGTAIAYLSVAFYFVMTNMSFLAYIGRNCNSDMEYILATVFFGTTALFAAGAIWTYMLYHPWTGKRNFGPEIPDKLVITGPYTVFRHPIYAFTLAAAVSLSIFLNIASGLVMGAPGYLGTMLMFILFNALARVEEKELLVKFGDEYREYMSVTHRWFPSFFRVTGKELDQKDFVDATGDSDKEKGPGEEGAVSEAWMDLEYGRQSGVVPENIQLLEEFLVRLFSGRPGEKRSASVMDKNDAKQVAATLARSKTGSFEILKNLGVITAEEKKIIFMGRDSISVLENKDLTSLKKRLTGIVNAYYTEEAWEGKKLTAKQRKDMLKRLIPVYMIQDLADQYGVAPGIMLSIIAKRPNYLFWLKSAKEKVDKIHSTVKGTRNAWLLVKDKGLNNVDEWILAADEKVKEIQSLVGGPRNAWTVVISQGIANARLWCELAELWVETYGSAYGSKAKAWRYISSNSSKIKVPRSPGTLKDIGDGGVESLPYDFEQMLKDMSGTSFFRPETMNIQGIEISAKVLDGTLPEGINAWHFIDDEEELVIIIRTNLPEDLREEAVYHEAREAHWTRTLSKNRGVVNTVKEIAHRLAAAEEVIAFGRHGITPYHRMQLNKFANNEEKIRELLMESREEHFKEIGQILGEEALDRVKRYEKSFREALKSLPAYETASTAVVHEVSDKLRPGRVDDLAFKTATFTAFNLVSSGVAGAADEFSLRLAGLFERKGLSNMVYESSMKPLIEIAEKREDLIPGMLRRLEAVLADEGSEFWAIAYASVFVSEIARSNHKFISEDTISALKNSLALEREGLHHYGYICSALEAIVISRRDLSNEVSEAFKNVLEGESVEAASSILNSIERLAVKEGVLGVNSDTIEALSKIVVNDSLGKDVKRQAFSILWGVSSKRPDLLVHAEAAFKQILFNWYPKEYAGRIEAMAEKMAMAPGAVKYLLDRVLEASEADLAPAKFELKQLLLSMPDVEGSVDVAEMMRVLHRDEPLPGESFWLIDRFEGRSDYFRSDWDTIREQAGSARKFVEAVQGASEKILNDQLSKMDEQAFYRYLVSRPYAKESVFPVRNKRELIRRWILLKIISDSMISMRHVEDFMKFSVAREVDTIGILLDIGTQDLCRKYAFPESRIASYLRSLKEVELCSFQSKIGEILARAAEKSPKNIIVRVEAVLRRGKSHLEGVANYNRQTVRWNEFLAGLMLETNASNPDIFTLVALHDSIDPFVFHLSPEHIAEDNPEKRTMKYSLALVTEIAKVKEALTPDEEIDLTSPGGETLILERYNDIYGIKENGQNVGRLETRTRTDGTMEYQLVFNPGIKYPIRFFRQIPRYLIEKLPQGRMVKTMMPALDRDVIFFFDMEKKGLLSNIEFRYEADERWRPIDRETALKAVGYGSAADEPGPDRLIYLRAIKSSSKDSVSKVAEVRKKDTDEAVGSDIRGFMLELGYAEEDLGNVPVELIKYISEVKGKFPYFKETIENKDVSSARKALLQIAGIARLHGFERFKRNAGMDFIMNAPGEENLFELLSEEGKGDKSERQWAETQLLTCVNISVMTYITLRSLGIEKINTVHSAEHVLLSLPIENGRELFVDLVNREVRIVDLAKVYVKSKNSDFWSLSAPSPSERPVLESFYPYFRLKDEKGIMASVHKNRADAYYSLKMYDKAISEYMRALKIVPDDLEVAVNMANIQHVMGDHASAARWYSRAIEVYTELTGGEAVLGVLYYDRAESYWEMGLYKLAGGDYQEALKYLPENDPDLARVKKRIKDAEKRFSEEEKTLPKRYGADEILSNAEAVIPRLVNALIAAGDKGEKVVLALDEDLGRGEINELLRKIIKLFPNLENNNKELERFFKDLEIVKGSGTALASRISNITDAQRGRVAPENVIIITKSSNLALYSSVKGRAIMAGIEDSVLSEDSYLPLTEVVLFAVGRFLGWSEEGLRKCYGMIPNAIAESNMDAQEAAGLFGGDERTLVIRMVPDAVEFDKKELREIMESLRTMLARA